MKLNQRKHYFLCYTAVFLIVCTIGFSWYFMAEKALIGNTDGWNQHYKALVYWGRYLRRFIKELIFNHRLILQEWEFVLGEGNDILQSLHYYVIGDPLTLFSVLVPSKWMWIYYTASIFLRLYLAGLIFAWLCFYTKRNLSSYGVLAGAITYIFCYWTIINANRHIYFLNPMIYFPLIIIGIEKIICKEKPYVFIGAVFLSAISNFYYFYMIVILTIIYVAVRLIAKYKSDLKSIALDLFRMGCFAILGTLMSAVILVPVCYIFLNDPRMNSENAWHFLYPISYYSKLLHAFFAGEGNYWLCMGYSAPTILAVCLLLLQKKEKLLKIYLGIGLVMIMIPACGQFLNGMSYMCNRWSWAFALLCAYILAIKWDNLMDLRIDETKKLFLCLLICFIMLLFLEYSRTMAAFAGIGIAFIFLCIIAFPNLDKFGATVRYRKPVLALVVVVLGVLNISFFENAAATGKYANESIDRDVLTNQFTLNDAAAVKRAAKHDNIEEEFYRFSGSGITLNANMIAGISSTQYYWSLINSAVNNYRTDLAMREYSLFLFRGYDDRTAPLALSSVRYYVLPEKDKSPVPYGFSYVDTFNVKSNITDDALKALETELGESPSEDQIKVIQNATASRYKIYRNEYTLPLAYVYQNTISNEMWQELSAVGKQEAMLQGVKLDGGGYINSTDNLIHLTSQELDYDIKCNSSGVTLEDYGIVVTSANSSITLNFQGLPNSETYVSVKGLDFEGTRSYDLYFGDDRYDPLNLYTKTRWDLQSFASRESARKTAFFSAKPNSANLVLKSSEGVSKTINYYTEDYSWYNDRHDFTVNLGYSEEAVDSVTITFSATGIYSLDSLHVTCQPMEQYPNQVKELGRYGLDQWDIRTDTVEGDVTLDEPGILCFSIPYSVGWTAYVDGEKAELYQANIKNMAVILESGNHQIKLVYHTPLLRAGMAMSVVGFTVLGIIILRDQRKRRDRNGS